MSRNILKAGIIVLLGTMLYKVAFLAKDILLTSKLGVGDELTLFVTAFLIPSFLCNTLAQSLQVSTSDQIVRSHKSLSLSYLKNIFFKTCLIGIIAFSLIQIIIPYIFSSFKPYEIQNLRFVTLLSFPFFIFITIRGVLGQILYLRQYHLLNFVLALISPISLIIYLLISKSPSALTLMIVLSLGTIAEFFCVLFVTYSLNGIKKNSSDLSDNIKLKDILHGFFLQLLLMLPPLTDQLFAHLSGTRFLTVFNYAIKIPNIIITISMIISASVLLPYFIENKNTNIIKKPSNKKLTLFLCSLVLFYLIIPFVSPIIVQIIYERGKFTLSDSLQVSTIQTYYFWSVPMTSAFMVYVRYLNANQKHSQAVWLALSVSVCSIVFGGVWAHLGLFHFIPFSIIGSYIVTILIFLFYRRKLTQTAL